MVSGAVVVVAVVVAAASQLGVYPIFTTMQFSQFTRALGISALDSNALEKYLVRLDAQKFARVSTMVNFEVYTCSDLWRGGVWYRNAP